MYPTLFTESLALSSYDVFFRLSVIVVLGGSRYTLVISHHKPKKAITMLLLAVMIGGIVWARVLHVITRRSTYAQSPELILSFSPHGFSGYGAIILACLFWWIVTRHFHEHPFKIADLVSPWLWGGIVVMRVWCFLHGCCFGKPTDLPRWIQPVVGSDAYLYQFQQSIITKGVLVAPVIEPIHPTQVYDALVALSGAGISYRLRTQKIRPGIAAAVFVIRYTTGRYFLAPFRAPASSYDAPLHFFPIVYGVFICGIIVMIIMQKKIILSQK